MEVAVEHKKGYKKTKLGWIPEDWELRRVDSFAKTSAGGTPSTKVPAYWNGDIPWMSSGDLNMKTILNVDGRITELGLKESSAKIVPINSILIGLAGQGKTRGTVAVNKIKLSTNQSVAFIIPTDDEIYYQYVYHNLDHRYNELRRLSTGDGGRGGLNLKLINGIKVPLPSFSEQKAIANCLNTWDKAIQDISELIEQKALQKKGLMQLLLTGEMRLKGYDGEWETLKAGSLFKSHSNKNHNGDLEVLSATQDKGVIPRSMLDIDIKYDKKSLVNYKKVEKGDFVISLRSFQGGIEYSDFEGLISPAYTVLKEARPIAKTFYREYMKTTNFIKKLNSIIYGIRDGKQISYKEFATLKIQYPPVDEQEAISKVILALDEEIELLKLKLDLLKEQKKGLMQQLLTGKKRLKF